MQKETRCHYFSHISCVGETQSDYPKLDQSTPTVAKSHFRSERTRSTDYI